MIDVRSLARCCIWHVQGRHDSPAKTQRDRTSSTVCVLMPRGLCNCMLRRLPALADFKAHKTSVEVGIFLIISHPDRVVEKWRMDVEQIVRGESELRSA